MVDGSKFRLSRRSMLKMGLTLAGGSLLPNLLHANVAEAQADTKQIYIAPDDHTDYYWTADGNTYRQAFLDMLDYYLDRIDATIGNRTEHQARWNCDGHFWLWTYEKNRTPQQFERLINRIRSGHISAPLNALAVLYGGTPAEAAIRGMYYPGRLERRYNIRFQLAYSMENQTLPYGIASIWAGAGAKYSWKGICACVTAVPLIKTQKRPHEIYYAVGPDGSRILMKWYSYSGSNQSLGGYAEDYFVNDSIDKLDALIGTTGYPYQVAGGFGRGWDDLKTMTDEFVTAAQAKTNASRTVIVSNEVDFFKNFEARYGAGLPTVSASFGNEWELYCASLAEVSASVKRSLETLRGAEAVATLVSLADPTFIDSRAAARDQAWMNLGQYWEHTWTADGPVPRTTRAAWSRQLAGEIASYVNTLKSDGISRLGGLIARTSASNTQFFVFNPLSWSRTDAADFPYSDPSPVTVIDLTTGAAVPSQRYSIDGTNYLRILASNVPPVGYKVYEIRPGAGQQYPDAATINGAVIENASYKITVSNLGAITSLLDKTRGSREFIRTINNRAANDLGGGSGGTLTIENVGPVSATLVATGSSPLNHTSRITLLADSRRIDIRNNITQNFNSIQTWAFGFNLTNPDTWHEEVGAIIRAKLTTHSGHYYPTLSRYDWLTLHHFADMTGSDNTGVTLSNWDCYFMKLGNSTKGDVSGTPPGNLDETTPQISVLAGGQVDGPNFGILSQGGDTSFLQRFALQTHSAYDPAAAMRFALEHQNPFITGVVTGGNFYPPKNLSILTVSNPNVLLWALKPAEEGISTGVVGRFWNMSSAAQSASIRLSNVTVTGAQHVSHIETPIAAVGIGGGAISAAFKSQQILTYQFKVGYTAVLPPTLLKPDNDTVVPTLRPLFSWRPVAGTIYYDLQLDLVTPPAAAPIRVAGTSYTPAAPLQSAAYYWRVRSVAANGATSDWSDIRMFIAGGAPPRNFYQTGSPTLTWTQISWATAYEVQVSSSTSFAGTLAFSQNDIPISLSPQIQVNPPLPDGTYYWRVRAKDRSGVWRAWSTTDTFTIDVP
jgi:alpha-mannosidase